MKNIAGKEETYVLGIDTGGTFTDVVALSSQGRVTMAKSATTPSDFSTGVVNAIEELSKAMGMSLEDLLRNTTIIKHGSTVATNALITMRGVKTGFVTTKGFEDTTLIMRAIGRTDGLGEEEIRHVIRVRKPEPIVPRELIRGVSERIDYQGNIVVRLNLEEAKEAVRSLVEKERVKAVAVSFLHSWVNPAHERQVKELCDSLYGDGQVYFSFGNELCRLAGEYGRSNTAIINSYVGPIIKTYLDNLEAKLQSRGFRGMLLLMQGNGGAVRKSQSTPIGNVSSGPAGGMMASAYMAKLLAHPNAITTDMGGTSFDVGLITEGFWRYAPEPIVERFRVLQPIIQIESIGAGGGTIARVDKLTGRLLVGPGSAGADPGPACYDSGGQEVTVTDCDVVLGMIDPGYFLGGRRLLNKEKALRRLEETIARPLHVDAVEAAAGVYDVINSKMADLIRKQVIQVGYLPEEFVIYSFGGAAPLHAVGYAADLGIKKIYVFPTSPVFSAFGAAISDVVHSQVITCQYQMPADPETLNARLDAIEQELAYSMANEGFSKENVDFRRYATMLYRRQMAGCEIPIPWARFSTSEIARLKDLYEAKYEELYGSGARYGEAGIEISSIRVDAVGKVPKPELKEEMYHNADASHALKGQRAVYFTKPTIQPLTTKIYEYARLRHGNLVEGPAVVESSFTSVLIPPKCTATVDAYLDLVIEIP